MGVARPAHHIIGPVVVTHVENEAAPGKVGLEAEDLGMTVWVRIRFLIIGYGRITPEPEAI
jgi:hypothetical protein